MNKKFIIGAIITIGIIWIIKKYKKSNASISNTNNSNINNNTQSPGSVQFRGQTVLDNTRRRCVDANGKTVYVDGPCPAGYKQMPNIINQTLRDVVVDTTRRRCVDANGKTIYVDGPCPAGYKQLSDVSVVSLR